MAREIPVDVLDKIGAAADAADQATQSQADEASATDAARAAAETANAAKGKTAADKKGAADAQASAVKALTDWLSGTPTSPPPAPTTTSRR